MESKIIAKRLVSCSFLRVTFLMCNIGVSFFLIPFLIHALGERLYGFWILVSAFLGFYGYLDIGLSSAVVRYVSRAYGQGDDNEINYIVNTCLVLFLSLGLLAFIFSYLAVFLSPYFIKDNNEVLLFTKVIYILGVSLSLGFPMRTFIGILTAKIRYDLLVGVQFFKLVVRTLLIIYFIKMGYNIIALALITFFVDLLGHALYFYFAKRELPQLKLSFSLFQMAKVKSLFGYSLFSFIAQLGGILRFKIDSFVIAGFLDLNAVTHYFIGARLIEFFIQFVSSAMGIVSPVFSQYEGRNDFNSIRKLFLEATKFCVLLAVFVGTSLIIFGKVFINRWMGFDYNDSYNVLLILCGPIMASLMQNPSIGLMYGLSKHNFFSLFNSCEGISNLILSLILIKYFGIYGVALGTAIPMLLIKLVFQPLYVCSVINIKPNKYYLDIIMIMIMKVAVPILLGWFVFRSYLLPNYINILCIAVVYMIFFSSISYFFLLTSKQRQLLITCIRREKK